MGKYKYENLYPEFQLEEELASSLRGLKTESSSNAILREEYNKIFKRGQLEAQAPYEDRKDLFHKRKRHIVKYKYTEKGSKSSKLQRKITKLKQKTKNMKNKEFLPFQ